MSWQEQSRGQLALNPAALAAVRTPTAGAPWRVLVSGCLHGLPCGVDGTDYGMAGVLPAWLSDPRVERVPFCPEDHGLGTPRRMPDLHGGDGFAVLDGAARVLGDDGSDLTAGLLRGAEAMVALARERGIDFAVLTDRSGACGSQVISLGNRFVVPVVYRRGVGVAAAALLRAGVPVVSQRDRRTLALLGARLDPALAPAPDARDHHESDWMREHLPTPASVCRWVPEDAG